MMLMHILYLSWHSKFWSKWMTHLHFAVVLINIRMRAKNSSGFFLSFSCKVLKKNEGIVVRFRRRFSIFMYKLTSMLPCECERMARKLQCSVFSLFFAVCLWLCWVCLLNEASESRHKAHTLKKKRRRRSFLEKQLWQEIENKSGCIYPLSGHVIVRRECAEGEGVRLGLYVRCKIGETNFHLFPSHPRHSAWFGPRSRRTSRARSFHLNKPAKCFTPPHITGRR